MKEYFDIALVLFPVIGFVVLFLRTSKVNGLSMDNNVFIWMFLALYLIVVAFYPTISPSDKELYTEKFLDPDFYIRFTEKDLGFLYVLKHLNPLFNGNPLFFFVLSSFLLVAALYAVAKTYLSMQHAFYMIVMQMGCIGFSNLGTNIIRNGIAISLIAIGLWCLSYKKRVWMIVGLALIVSSLAIHKSTIIVLSALLIARFLTSNRVIELIWIVALLFSLVAFDSSSWFEDLEFFDARVDHYTSTGDMVEMDTMQGFRFDFLIYSMLPIILAKGMKKHFKCIREEYYWVAYRTYLIANAFWLLFMRAPHTDRFAILSWQFMPFLLLFPYIKHQEEFKEKRVYMFLLMFVFIGLKVFLTINDLRK